MNAENIKRRVLERIKTPLYNFYEKRLNENSPVDGDKREWFFCKLCSYNTLDKHGIVIHLSKYHNIKRQKNITQEELIDITINETFYRAFEIKRGKQ